MTQSATPIRLRWFSRLSYPQKFIIISLIFILPLLAFGPLIYQQMVRIDQYGTKEYYGTLYLRPVQRFLVAVQHHEQLIARKWRNIDVTADLLAAQAEADEALSALEAVDREYSDDFQTGTQVEDLRTQWRAIKADASSLRPLESDQQHSKLINATKTLVIYVGDASFLILDPDLDTYYLMDTVLLRMPEMQTSLSEVLIFGEDVLDDGLVNIEDAGELKVYRSQLKVLADALKANAEKSIRENEIGTITPRNAEGQMGPLVEPALNEAAAANNNLIANIENLISGQRTVSLPDYTAAVERAIDANQGLYNSTSEALELGARARQARYSGLLFLALISATLGVLVGLAVGLSVMQSISRPLSDLVLASKRLSTGDLTARAPVNSDDEVGQVAIAFNSFIDSLSRIVGRLVDSSTKLSSGTTQISAASNEMSAGAESQTQQAIRTSSAMEEIAATIKEVANNADATARATHAAATRARDGSGKVQAVLKQLAETNESLQGLRTRSAEIDQLVKLIADIAAQTNILSLNAAIEAAGAGAAGARFDVVAEEIRKLAQRTAESTARISGTVSRIQEEMQAVAQRTSALAAQAEDVGQTLSDIVEGATSVNDMIASISSSTSQQSKAVEQVAVSLQLITQVSQQTAQAAHETASTIDDLSGLAHEMSATAAQFKV